MQADLKPLFQAQYQLYLEGVPDITLEACEQKAQDQQISESTSFPDDFMAQLFWQFPGLPPVTLVKTRDSVSTYSPVSGVMRLKHSSSTPEACFREVQKCLVDHQWHQNGLPLDPPERHDILLSALFRIWQRGYAMARLQMGIPDDIYPMTPAEKNSLSLRENQPLIEAAIALLEAGNFAASPVLYRELRQKLKTDLDSINTVDKSPDRKSTPQKSTPQKSTLQKSTLQKSTLQKSTLQKSTLQKSTLQKSTLQKSTLQKSTLQEQWQENQHKLASYLPASDSKEQSVEVGKGTEALLLNLSKKASDDDVTVERTFPDYPVTQYRTYVLVPKIDDDGHVTTVRNGFGRQGFDWATPAPFTDKYSLSLSEKQGRITSSCLPNVWTPLPGLSHRPQSELVALSTSPEGQVDVVRDRATDLYLFRWQPNESLQVCEADKIMKITLNMVLQEREQKPSASLSSGFQPISCPPPLQKALDELMALDELTAQQPDLKEILDHGHPEDQVKAIKTLVSSFMSLDYNFDASYSDVHMLSGILRQTPGPGYYRSLAFWSLATGCGIPCRITGNDTSHLWCEYSLDGGYCWQSMDPGNKSPTDGKGKIIEEEPDYQKLESEKPDEFEKLLASNWNISQYSPEKIAHYMKTIVPGSKQFKKLYRKLHHLIAFHISPNGPVSVAFVKELLQDYHLQGCLQENLLARLLNALQDYKSVNPQVSLCYQELWNFIVKDRRWVTAQTSPNGLINMGIDPNEVEIDYFQKALTTTLKRGTDIKISTQSESEHCSAHRKHLADCGAEFFTPLLDRTLLGEVPGEGYRELPPGKLDPTRLARHQPCFRQSATKPALRPALIVAPTSLDCSLIGMFIKQALTGLTRELAKEELCIPGCHLSPVVSTSRLLQTFLTQQVHRAFLTFFYHKAGGKEGDLKLLYPADRKPQKSSGHEADPGTTTVVEAEPNLPARAGVFKPDTEAEFLTLAQESREAFNTYDDQLLSEAWVRKGFNDGSLCLVTNNMLKVFANEFFQEIDWASLVKKTRTSQAFKEYVENARKQKKEEYATLCAFKPDEQPYFTPVDQVNLVIDDFLS